MAGDRDSPVTAAPERAVRIGAGRVVLNADLALPAGAAGLIVFAHGSGSGRRSPRNRQVAAALERRGLATLLVDLLTTAEGEIDARTRALRFDIPLLAGRVCAAVDWAAAEPAVEALPVGLFGASTGAAAALIAAARRTDRVGAVVSRGGRPDLAADALTAVHAPTLLLVGGEDLDVLALNQAAQRRLRAAETRLEVVPGAGHLFEEPGAMEHVIDHAAAWFDRWLRR
jgi:putative phosphoribosyl transferase